MRAAAANSGWPCDGKPGSSFRTTVWCGAARCCPMSSMAFSVTREAGGRFRILLRRPSGARAMQALAEVDLADKALQRADALSGGQQQRVAIARALVRRPRLLIADEPAASLDPVSGRNVMELFTQLCRDHGITLLYTSHDMAHAVDYADRIVALKGGKVLFDRPAAQVTRGDLKDTFDG